MRIRILTALVLVPPALYLIGWAPGWLFVLAVIAVAERALYEYFAISAQTVVGSFRAIGYAACALIGLLQAAHLRFLRAPIDLEFAAVLVLTLLLLTVALRTVEDLKTYLPAVATTFWGVIYIGATFSCLIPLRLSSRISPAGEGRFWVLLLFLAIWGDDAGAYFTGHVFGRTPLAPRISPKKTLEGSVGGFLASLLIAWLFTGLYGRWFGKTADLKTVILLVALFAVAGQVGDLAESALKRGAAVKDSSELLPGHGGMLDRIDSLLFAAPALWMALALKGLWKP